MTFSIYTASWTKSNNTARLANRSDHELKLPKRVPKRKAPTEGAPPLEDKPEDKEPGLEDDLAFIMEHDDGTGWGLGSGDEDDLSDAEEDEDDEFPDEDATED